MLPVRLLVSSFLIACSCAHASTVAYWRFENGPANANVPHATAAGVFDGSTPDVSGNGNNLSVWTLGGGSGFVYRGDVPYATVPQDGTTNLFSIKNSGSGPASFTKASVSLPTGVNIDTFTPAQFSVELSCKPEITGGYRTLLSRDAKNIATADANLAALYLQIRPDDSVGIAFTDVSGYTHSAFSPPGWMYGFNFGSNPDGVGVPWYSLAATSDGNTLKMYVDKVLVASTNIAASGSPNRALAKGSVNGSDWTTGSWAVGRGLYGGNHTDRAYGFIDEVRISDKALATGEMLTGSVPQVSGIAMSGVAATIQVTKGQPGGTCLLMQSTDLATWTQTSVNVFDSNGNVSFFKPVNPAVEPKMFFKAMNQEAPPPVGALTYSMGWGWENAPAGARDNMNYIMSGVVALFNRYGTFPKHLQVNYNAGVPTAQGSFNGNIDFGSNIGAYHNFRVAAHETAHTLGVGTTWQWGANLSGGHWTGAKGIAKIQELDGPGAVINSDGTHFWPYGLNLGNEGGTENFVRCAKMVWAFWQDMGL